MTYKRSAAAWRKRSARLHQLLERILQQPLANFCTPSPIPSSSDSDTIQGSHTLSSSMSSNPSSPSTAASMASISSSDALGAAESSDTPIFMEPSSNGFPSPRKSDVLTGFEDLEHMEFEMMFESDDELDWMENSEGELEEDADALLEWDGTPFCTGLGEQVR
jgi:hypothetical protein